MMVKEGWLSIMANKTLIGPYSAYAIAVKHGYQGTEAEWAKTLIDAGNNAASAAESKTAAAQSAENAATSEANVAQAEERINTAVSGAVEAVTAQETKSVQAVAAQEQTSTAAVTAEGKRVLGTIPQDYTELSNGVSQLKDDLTNLDGFAHNSLRVDFGGYALEDGYLRDTGLLFPPTANGEKTTGFVILDDAVTGINLQQIGATTAGTLWGRIVWFNANKEKDSYKDISAAAATVLTFYPKPENAKYVRVSWRGFGSDISLCGTVENAKSIVSGLETININKANTVDVNEIKGKLLGVVNANDVSIASKVVKKELFTFDAIEGKEYTFRVQYKKALTAEAYWYPLYQDGSSMFSTTSWFHAAGTTNKTTSITAKKTGRVSFSVTTNEASVEIETVDVTFESEINARIDSLEGKIKIEPILHNSSFVSDSNVTNTFIDNNIFKADALTIKTTSNAFSGIRFVIHNVRVGDVISAKATRNVGNDGFIRIDCFGNDGKRIGKENWSGEKTVVDGTAYVEVTVAACWGTALGADIEVTFNNLEVRYANVDKLELSVHGSGNTLYTGKRIVLSNDDARQNKCNIDLWKDFTPDTVPNIATYKFHNNQSITVYGGYVFTFQQGSNGGAVLSYSTKQVLSTFTIANPNTRMHMNSAQFCGMFYDANDEFPMLLLSRCGNADGAYTQGYDECLVYRVQRSGNNFAFTLVNKITTDAVTYGNSWGVDNVNGTIYMAGSTKGNWEVKVDNPIGYWVWKIPTRLELVSENTINLAKTECIAHMEHPFAVLQGCCAHGGMLYVGMETSVWAVDVMSGRVASKVPLPVTWEPEGVALYNEKLYVSQKVGNDTAGNNPMRIYELDFN